MSTSSINTEEAKDKVADYTDPVKVLDTDRRES